jgi:hypothetical protein
MDLLSLSLLIKMLSKISSRTILISALTIKVEITISSTSKTIRTNGLDRISSLILMQAHNNICMATMKPLDIINSSLFLLIKIRHRMAMEVHSYTVKVTIKHSRIWVKRRSRSKIFLTEIQTRLRKSSLRS